ncbi:uncharacterized protein LOC101212326 [Cucumis sativus]|uniref:DUF241 domain protein n=1 Tax=Cucumis sativus TaxID=3659 RepID=A0A0A0K1I3_CUCSA|nr:uncharacterized protein LOC101212326 [Cucumis sativus]KGN43323.1 hypothetical protein Csa_020213 [Cucumis sativus]
MDASTLNQRNSQHVRSKSVPSNPHPIISQVDEQLSRLRDSEAISSSSSSLCHKLSALQDLHDSVDKLLILPLSQQALVQVSDKEELDNLLEGSLRLLDLCDTAKKALMQTRECTHEFESVLRRRRSDIGTSSSLKKCLSSRKLIKKAIHKVLKGMESKQTNKDSESFTFVNQIKEVEAVTYQSIVSLLFFIAGPKLPAKWNCWSSVSKLVQSKKVACISEETSISIVERLDLALSSITNHQSDKDFQIHVGDMQNLLRDCGASIKKVEEELEGLYRFIIKIRVSLLNIFNY